MNGNNPIKKPPIIIELKPQNEYRLESTDPVTVVLLSGTAELCGMDLVVNKMYNLTTTFIFTYTGCVLRIDSNNSSSDWFGYTSTDTNIPDILKFVYEKKGTWNIRGPGKTTFIKTAMNYGIRLNKKVIITELDPTTGLLFAPSICGLAYMNDPFEELDIQNMLLYYYPNKIEKDDSYHKTLKGKLEDLKIDYDLNLVISNINTYPNICVLNDERMFYKLSSDIIEEKVYIKKTGGLVRSNKISNQKVRKYFYNNTFQKYLLKCENKIFKIGEDTETPKTALPIGKESKLDVLAVNECEVKSGDVVVVTYSDEDSIDGDFGNGEGAMKVCAVKAFGLVKDGKDSRKILFGQSKCPTGFYIKIPNVLHANE